MKDDKITVTGDDLRVTASAPERFSSLADPDRRRAAWRHLSHASPFRTLHMLSVRHMIRKRIPSSMNKYNCTAVRYHVDAQELLCIARHKTSRKQASVAHQYTALLMLPDRNMPPTDDAYQGPLPSCELHSHDSRSLTVRRYSMKVRRYTS